MPHRTSADLPPADLAHLRDLAASLRLGYLPPALTRAGHLVRAADLERDADTLTRYADPRRKAAARAEAETQRARATWNRAAADLLAR